MAKQWEKMHFQQMQELAQVQKEGKQKANNLFGNVPKTSALIVC